MAGRRAASSSPACCPASWSGVPQPLSRVGGTRWLQMLGTVSSMLASLRAASASVDATAAADVAAQEAAATSQTVAAATGQEVPVAPAGTAAPSVAAEPLVQARAPAPAEAATDVSER
ncbi:hypothetical protein H1235_02410 [Pseudoxanthomonas sp. NC8]|nr:hypothetical protein H1235_02410 [Pseudoxanthomonas sp. NC8]